MDSTYGLVYFYGYVYGHRVLILHEARFNKYRAYLSLGLVSIITGTYSFTRPISIIIGSYSFTKPISTNFGTYSSTRPISANFGTYSSTRPISYQILGLTPHEVHYGKFWDLLLHEAYLGDSSNFSNFPLLKMEKFAPVCSVE